mgnify:CR=1 FL=1
MKNNFEFEKHKDTSTKHTCFQEYFNDLLRYKFIYNVYCPIGYDLIKINSSLTNNLFDNYISISLENFSIKSIILYLKKK